MLFSLWDKYAFCRKTDNNANLPFFGSFLDSDCVAFTCLCRESGFVANTHLFGFVCPDFYSDIEDFTQILCRYLPKKLAVGTSAPSGQITFLRMLPVKWPKSKCFWHRLGVSIQGYLGKLFKKYIFFSFVSGV